MQGPLEHGDELVEALRGVGVAQGEADVVIAPDREQRAVEDVGGRRGRVFLDERAALQGREGAAVPDGHVHRPQRRSSTVGERLVPGLPVQAREEARALALGDRGDPWCLDAEGVRHVAEVQPPARLRAVGVLGLEQVPARSERGLEPGVALSSEVALEAPEAPLSRRHVQLALARRKPRRRPARLIGLQGEVDVVAAEVLVGRPVVSDRGRERRLAGKEVGAAGEPRPLAVAEPSEKLGSVHGEGDSLRGTAKLPGVKAEERPPRLRVMTMADGVGAFGGAEALARQVAEGLDPDRFESILCVTRWNPDPKSEAVREELEAGGTSFIGLERKGRLDIAAWRRLIADMRERRIDVLHTHKIGSNFWGALIAPRVPVPVFVAHEHTWSWEGKPHRKLADRFLIARRAAAFVAVSEADRGRMVEDRADSPGEDAVHSQRDPGAGCHAHAGRDPR